MPFILIDKLDQFSTIFHKKSEIRWHRLNSGKRQLCLIFESWIHDKSSMEKMEKLPPEILSQIAQNLEGKDLVALTGTNENISQPLSNHRLLWKRHLDVSDQPGLSPLKKSIPDHSRTCPEKDEFLLRMRLEKNWSNFNYEVCDTIPPRDAGQTEMRLACLYADFAVFFHPLGRNTWNIIIFDSEISKFQSVTFTVPCPTECYWRASEMTLHKIHVGSSRRLFVFELFCDEAFQQEIVVFDISKEGGSNILWRSSYEKSASLIELAKDFLYIFRVSLTNLSVQILDASTGQNIGQAVDNSINKTNFQLRPIKANRHQEVGQKIDKIVVGSKLHGASIFKKVSSFITYDTTKNCFDWWQNEDSKELTQVGNKICLKKWSGTKIFWDF